MHDLQVQSRQPRWPLLFLLLLPPGLQKTLGVMGTLQGKRSRVPPPHPLLPAARTSPAEPWVCIPLRLPRTWGGIKGKVARACLIKGLWTETKPEVAEGTRVRGRGRERVGPGRCAFPPAGRGASGTGRAALTRSSARGQARLRPARGDTEKASLSSGGCLALVTIFGLVRRHLGCLAFNCLLERRRCPESASVAGDAASPTGGL